MKSAHNSPKKLRLTTNASVFFNDDRFDKVDKCHPREKKSVRLATLDNAMEQRHNRDKNFIANFQRRTDKSFGQSLLSGFIDEQEKKRLEKRKKKN